MGTGGHVVPIRPHLARIEAADVVWFWPHGWAALAGGFVATGRNGREAVGRVVLRAEAAKLEGREGLPAVTLKETGGDGRAAVTRLRAELVRVFVRVAGSAPLWSDWCTSEGEAVGQVVLRLEPQGWRWWERTDLERSVYVGDPKHGEWRGVEPACVLPVEVRCALLDAPMRALAKGGGERVGVVDGAAQVAAAAALAMRGQGTRERGRR